MASSKTAEILSKQFGKAEKVFVTNSFNKKKHQMFGGNVGESESVQERDVIKASEFLGLQVGEFAGVVVESNKPTFKTRFKQAQRPLPAAMIIPTQNGSIMDYYRQVRNDITQLLEGSGTVGEYDRDTAKLNETKKNIFDVKFD